MRAQSCSVCISKSACLSVIERNLPFSCSLPISESARLLVLGSSLPYPETVISFTHRALSNLER